MIDPKLIIIIFLSFILITLFIFGRKKIIENYPRNKWAECNNACKSYNKVDLANTSTDGTCLYYIDLNTGKCGPKWSHGRDVQSFHAWGKKGYIDCTYCQIENNRGKAPKEREQVCFPHNDGPYEPFLKEEIENTHGEREWRKEQGHPEEWWPVLPQRPPDDHFPPPGQYIKDSCFGTYPDDTLEYKMKLVRLYNHLKGWFGYMPEDPRLNRRETEIAARKCVEANDWDCPVSKYGDQVPKRIQDILKKKAAEPSETSPVFISPPPPPLINDPTCAKESSCFDAQNSCNDCCSTGKNANGENCWTYGYSHERCCNAPDPSIDSPSPPSINSPSPSSINSPSPPSINSPSPLSISSPSPPSITNPDSECAKEQSCFDEKYPCELCCTTGVGTNGNSCWVEGTYSKEKCCNVQISKPNQIQPKSQQSVINSDSGVKVSPQQLAPTSIVPNKQLTSSVKVSPQQSDSSSIVSKCHKNKDVKSGFSFVKGQAIYQAKTDKECRNICKNRDDCNVWVREKGDGLKRCWLSDQSGLISFKESKNRNTGLPNCKFTNEADIYSTSKVSSSITPTSTSMVENSQPTHYPLPDVSSSPPIVNTPAYNPLESSDLTPEQCIPNKGLCSIYNRSIDTGGNIHKGNPLGLRVTTDTGKCMHYISPYGWCGFTSEYITNALADCTLCNFNQSD